MRCFMSLPSFSKIVKHLREGAISRPPPGWTLTQPSQKTQVHDLEVRFVDSFGYPATLEGPITVLVEHNGKTISKRDSEPPHAEMPLGIPSFILRNNMSEEDLEPGHGMKARRGANIDVRVQHRGGEQKVSRVWLQRLLVQILQQYIVFSHEKHVSHLFSRDGCGVHLPRSSCARKHNRPASNGYGRKRTQLRRSPSPHLSLRQPGRTVLPWTPRGQWTNPSQHSKFGWTQTMARWYCWSPRALRLSSLLLLVGEEGCVPKQLQWVGQGGVHLLRVCRILAQVDSCQQASWGREPTIASVDLICRV